MKSGFKNMNDIAENMNTFTKVMADVAVANQQDITSMIHQINELSHRMNGTAAHIESIMAGVDNNGKTAKMWLRLPKIWQTPASVWKILSRCWKL